MLFTGIAYSIRAFPILCRILTELKLLDTNVGIIVLSAAVGNLSHTFASFGRCLPYQRWMLDYTLTKVVLSPPLARSLAQVWLTQYSVPHAKAGASRESPQLLLSLMGGPGDRLALKFVAGLCRTNCVVRMSDDERQLFTSS
jgi:hypothetical protein